MLKTLKNKQAQVVASEYVLVFFIVLGMIAGMSVFFRRVIQGRIRDASKYTVEEAFRRVGPYYTSDDFLYQYEPYYVNTQSVVLRDVTDIDKLGPGASSGDFSKTFNENTRIQTTSNVLNPRFYKLNRPPWP